MREREMEERYEVRVVRPPHAVIAGSALVTIKCTSQEHAEQEFAKWTAMPAGTIESVEVVRIRSEVVRRWPEGEGS